MGFVNDLKQGEEMEERVSQVLTSYFWKPVNKNVDKKWVDLIIEDWRLMIEVKFDRMVGKTWNYAFEYKCSGKQSWVAKEYITEEWGETMPHYIVQAHKDGFELYHTYKLLKWIEVNHDRKVNGWDWWRSEMYLVKRENVLGQAIEVFNY